MFSQQYFLTYTVVFTGRIIMDCERSVIEEAHIHIFGFTHRKNNQLEKKLMRQNTNRMNMPPPPPPQLPNFRGLCVYVQAIMEGRLVEGGDEICIYSRHRSQKQSIPKCRT